MMPRSLLLYVSALLAMCTFPAAQDKPKTEPAKFRGAYLGEPLSDFMSCPNKSANDSTYHVHGKPCEEGSGSLDGIHHKSRWGGMRTALEGKQGAITKSPDAYDGMELTFSGSLLTRILIKTPKEEDFNQLVVDLVTKLGEPASTAPQVFQNGFGAKWEFPMAIWSKDGTAVVVGVDAKVANGGTIQTSGTKLLVEHPAVGKPLL